jgi:hypothetical protein
VDDVATDWLAAQHMALEAALVEWQTAKFEQDDAVRRLDKQRARLPAVSRALKMTEHEVRVQLHWAQTGTRPQSGHDMAAARRWANWTMFRRSKLAQDWYAKLAQAEADVPAARARLAEATRPLVALVGTKDAARATGLTPAQVSGLCHGSSHSEGLHL